MGYEIKDIKPCEDCGSTKARVFSHITICNGCKTPIVSSLRGGELKMKPKTKHFAYISENDFSVALAHPLCSFLNDLLDEENKQPIEVRIRFQEHSDHEIVFTFNETNCEYCLNELKKDGYIGKTKKRIVIE